MTSVESRGPLYDQIGRGYDTTRRADPAIVDALLVHLASKPGNRVLDLGCGTGNYTAAIRARGLDVVGLDRSGRMLETARNKDRRVPWLLGEAGRLPFADSAFGGALCTLAIHHFPDLTGPFAEVRRVLRGGRFVLFTATAEQIRRYWVCNYFPEAMSRAIQQMPSRSAVDEALARSGFTRITRVPFLIPPDLQDFFLYAGKHRPAMYLDPNVRAGISTFASLADPNEIAAGCERLAADIQSGRIGEIRARYRSDGGDYELVVASIV
ncbi:MAG: class I SAM-dependent methyltransferase [Chloroflexota bacterium]